MQCERFRHALSAALDGEEGGVDPAVLERHLSGCPACRRWESEVSALSRALRVGSADPIPDLTPAILAAIGEEVAPSRWQRQALGLRAALALVGVYQLILAAADFGLGASQGRNHVVLELGSFDVALAVGFLCAAFRPARAYGMLPLVTALVAFLGITAAIDVTGNNVAALAESTHVLDLVGLGLVWLVARLAPRPDGGGLRPSLRRLAA